MSLIKAISNSADALTLAIIQVVGAALIGVAESDRVSGDGDSPVTPEQANDILLSGLVVQVGQKLQNSSARPQADFNLRLDLFLLVLPDHPLHCNIQSDQARAACTSRFTPAETPSEAFIRDHGIVRLDPPPYDIPSRGDCSG
jgi:hypothetical protein